MANAEDDILQDFLVEAGELLEQLNEQLVELERRPQDGDLLNAIFRSFHTIKGGAGFLSLTELVEVCHRAEDVFNVLRQHQRAVDAGLMDTVLRVLDVVNAMFEQVRQGAALTPADPALLEDLVGLTEPEGAAPTPAPAPASPASAAQLPSATPAPDAEFEMIREALAGTEPGPARDAASPADAAEITDAEFEALLDQLHGSGAHQGVPPAEAGASAPAAHARDRASGDTISDDEFESLLDDLYGAGGAPGAAPVPAPAASAPDVARVAPVSAAAERPVAAAGETSVRVDTRRLDEIMNLVGELVLVRNRLATLRSTMGDDEISKAVANLGLVTSDLQASVMKTRMQPIRKVFGRFPRVVRDLARNLRKDVQLELEGEDTGLDKTLVEALADPLVHLVRNAVDHGVEAPEVREAAGKPRAGRVTLAAAQEGDHILLTIEDDGAGMDPERLRASAVEKGMMDAEAAARLGDAEAYNLIFAPGFSTKSEISDVSGRGVGMDVVKTRIAQLNGTISIDSVQGRGSTIRITVPLTLAILPTLMVILGEQTFALPLASVSEIFDLDVSRTKVVDGQEVVMVRDRALPLFFLRQWLLRADPGPAPDATSPVVVVHVGNQRIGFVVDRLVGQEEVVIKPLGAFLQGVAGLAGATITGDGKIALILDVPSLIRAHGRRR